MKKDSSQNEKNRQNVACDYIRENYGARLRYDVIAQNGIVPGANKLILFAYRFLGCTPIAALENVGLAVWALFFLCAYSMKKKNTVVSLATLPLWISLLVCMAAPCFFKHPRYALPIMCTLPFLFGFMLTGKKEDE